VAADLSSWRAISRVISSSVLLCSTVTFPADSFCRSDGAPIAPDPLRAIAEIAAQVIELDHDLRNPLCDASDGGTRMEEN
jgi:hypothetical protein